MRTLQSLHARHFQLTANRLELYNPIHLMLQSVQYVYAVQTVCPLFGTLCLL